MEQQPPKTKIQFKPLHDGMGFHPFSDGLPYAPASKAQTQTEPQTPTTGYGATAAGRPRFVHTTSPRPVSHSLANSLSTPEPLHTRTAALNSHLVINPSVAVTEKTGLITDTSLEKQIIRRRAFAYALDMVIHAGFWVLTNLAALFIFHFQIEPEIFTENLPQFIAFFALSQWLFIALQETLFETSIGKVFFNLEFKRNHRSLLLRSIVFMMGVVTLGIGFLVRPQDKLGEITLRSKIES